MSNHPVRICEEQAEGCEGAFIPRVYFQLTCKNKKCKKKRKNRLDRERRYRNLDESRLYMRNYMTNYRKL